MRIRLLWLVFVSALIVQGRAWAAAPDGATSVAGPWAVNWLGTETDSPSLPAHEWRIDWTTPTSSSEKPSLRVALAGAPGAADGQAQTGQAAPAPRPIAYEYSDAYNTRRKIHFYASFATLPLFVTQYVVGQKLYDGTATEGDRSLHSAMAASIAVLFGVNSVTGVWNLWEARKDPNQHALRMLHGILMLGADAGFVATGMLAPDREHEFESGGGSSPSTHRTVALTSMAVATVSYLMMLFAR